VTEAARQAQRKAGEKVRIVEENLKREQEVRKAAEANLAIETARRIELERSLDEVRKEKEGLESSIQDNRRETERAQARILHLVEANRANEEKFNEGAEELKQTKEANELLQSELQKRSYQFHDEKTAWDIEINELKTERQRMEQEKSNELNVLQQRLTDSEALLNSHEKAKEDLKFTITELQRRISEQDAHLSEFERKHENSARTITELQGRISQQEAYLSQFEHSKRVVEELQGQLSEQERTIADLRALRAPPPAPPLPMEDPMSFDNDGGGLEFPDQEVEPIIADAGAPQNDNLVQVSIDRIVRLKIFYFTVLV
jgi:DNA repair exonuclease SbcCD ATPase subunit